MLLVRIGDAEPRDCRVTFDMEAVTLLDEASGEFLVQVTLLRGFERCWSSGLPRTSR